MKMMRRFASVLALIAVAIFGAAVSASAQSRKPNIVVIFSDDVGV